MKVVSKLVENGKRVGFAFNNGEKLLDIEVLKRLKKNCDLGLKYSSDKFYLVNDKRSVKDLPELNIKEPKCTAINVYTGDTLRNLFKIVNGKKRTFVQTIKNYCNGGSKEVLCLAGYAEGCNLNGMLCAVDSSDLYNDALLLVIDFSRIVDIESIYKLIEFYNKRYIFIENATSIKDFVTLGEKLYARYVYRGYRIVVSGCDTYAFWSTNGNFSHLTVKNIFDIDYNDYLEIKRFSSKSGKDIVSYIKKYYIENLENSLVKNWKHFSKFKYQEDFYSGVVLVLYSYVLSRVLNMPIMDVESNILKRKDVITYLSKEFGDLSLSYDEYRARCFLERIGLVIKVNSLNGEERKYVLDPVIADSFYKSALKLSKYLGYKDLNLSKSSMYYLLECSLVEKFNSLGYSISYRGNSDVAFVIIKTAFNWDEVCYEVKLLRENAYPVKWVSPKEINEFWGEKLTEVNKIALYYGRNCKCKNTRFVNIGDFLLNINEFM